MRAAEGNALSNQLLARDMLCSRSRDRMAPGRRDSGPGRIRSGHWQDVSTATRLELVDASEFIQGWIVSDHVKVDVQGSGTEAGHWQPAGRAPRT